MWLHLEVLAVRMYIWSWALEFLAGFLGFPTARGNFWGFFFPSSEH